MENNATDLITQKRNVDEFNADVKNNQGYRYTHNAPYSSIVANARITAATLKAIPDGTVSIIDIGCGDGTYSHTLKTLRPQVSVTGIDPAADAISTAKEKFPEVKFNVGDLLDPSTLPSTKYDLGIIRGVLHHLPDAAAGIINATILSDKILIIEPNGNNPILKWIEKHSQYHIDHEEQSFSSDQLTKWCNAAGLKIISLDYIGFVPFFFPTALAKIIYFFQPILELIYPLKKYFGAQIVITLEKKK